MKLSLVHDALPAENVCQFDLVGALDRIDLPDALDTC